MSDEQLPPPASNKCEHHLHKVLIADDHAIFRHGLKVLLSSYPFIKFGGEASNGLELMKLIAKEEPNIVFIDLHMPGGHGTETIPKIVELYPKIKIVVLSFYDDALTIDRTMKMGASAYLTKNINIEIMDAMFTKILEGKTYYSPEAEESLLSSIVLSHPAPVMAEKSQWLLEEMTVRELEVLKKIARGFSHKEVAKALGLSKRTIDTHKEKIQKKLGAKNLAELISKAHEHKLI